MQLKTLRFVRKGQTIVDIEGHTSKGHGSKNKAKKASRAIQLREDKMLGLGTLRVDDSGVVPEAPAGQHSPLYRN